MLSVDIRDQTWNLSDEIYPPSLHYYCTTYTTGRKITVKKIKKKTEENNYWVVECKHFEKLYKNKVPLPFLA